MSRDKTLAVLQFQRLEAEREFHVQDNLSKVLWICHQTIPCPSQREEMYQESLKAQNKAAHLDRSVHVLKDLIQFLTQIKMPCPYCEPDVTEFLAALKTKQAAEDLQASLIRMKKRHTVALEKQTRKKKSVQFQLFQ